MTLIRKTGAVILAAGYSSRMGEFKPLMPVGNMTAVERIIGSAKNAGIDDIVLVTGYNREKLSKITETYGIKEAFNSLFSQGMFTSIKAGISRLDKDTEGFFIMPVDCPLIKEETLEKLTEGKADQMAVPTYMGKKGHPLYVPAIYAGEILALDNSDSFKTITDKYEDRMIRQETGSESVVLDMDDKAGYMELIEYYRNGCMEKDLRSLADGRRFMLIRHGQIRQHIEKIFLGQTDVPLGTRGMKQAEAAACRLAELGPRTNHIYSSDLARAEETAETIVRISKLNAVIYEKDFREMALGAWDGKYISSIKEKYPAEYEKRGRDVFRYKFDHNAENFFDLQYRVIRRLKKILQQDSKKDIVIVAHSGVIRAIENNLKGKDIKEAWDPPENGEIRIVDMS